MGFDISYHPIKIEEIKKWYFDALKDDSIVEIVSREFSLEDTYIEKNKDDKAALMNGSGSELRDRYFEHYKNAVQEFDTTCNYQLGRLQTE